MNRHSLIQLMRGNPAALRAIACAYVVFVALVVFDAVTAPLTDPQADSGHQLAGAALGAAGVACMLGVLWACSALESNLRARAVLRWLPVLLVLACCIPFAQTAAQALSTLVITVVP
jgi:hypothetical protein